jgi:glucose-6-phosphate 1-epimerase
MADVAQAACRPVRVQGLDALQLTLPNGDSATVALHGAHVLSWVAGGAERLYLSPRACLDGSAAIRGGVPVCFPQFNQRGGLVKHGFARLMPWTADEPSVEHDRVCLTLRLVTSAHTRSQWPHEFEAMLTVELSVGGLALTLGVRNLGQQAFAFTGALHSYFRVLDIDTAQLDGLAEPVRIRGEHDRVYAAASRPLLLSGGPSPLRIEQSPEWAHTVVWNPGAALSAAMSDLPDDGHRHILCVEAAQVFDPITLSPGASWQASQTCTLT